MIILMSSLKHTRKEAVIAHGRHEGCSPRTNTHLLHALLLTPAVLIFGMLAGCSEAPPTLGGDTANEVAAVDALNAWWKAFTYSPPPVKAGTVTPAHTVTSTNGRVHKVPTHVQTRKEAEDEAEDARFMQHKRDLVRSFSVKSKTVTVITNLTRDTVDIRDAQDLCHDLGAFVWANPNRHFGLQDIHVTGAHGEVLSFRNGLGGKVQ
jgi:hypothetical protein